MKKSLIFKVIISLLFIITSIIIYYGVDIYQKIYKPNVLIGGKKEIYFYIYTNSTYQQVFDSLRVQGIVKNINSFDWVAEKKNYKNKIKPGRYKLKSGMSNSDLVNLLRSGEQSPIRITINNMKTIHELAGFLSQKLELDSIDFLNIVYHSDTLQKYGFNKDNILCMFLPNTYEFYWNTNAYKTFIKMNQYYQKFWNTIRKNKAQKIGLNPHDVCVLASIVQKETNIPEQKPTVAGVYINRLNKKMLLQSDPTLIYALGDFSIKRVLNIHKLVESPYNTYKYPGLPPGPIVMPDLSTIDSTLNYEKHKYLFFCASPDLSGYHNFSETYDQHLIFAKKYQYALDTAKIFK